MKKQLLIAAIAATMASATMADISISGAAKINYTNVDKDLASEQDTDVIKHEMDLKVAGKSGDTSITMNFGGMDNSGKDAVATFNLEDAYVSTSVGDIAIKAGQWDNGNNELRASGRTEKVNLSTTVGGVKIAYEGANEADESVKVSGSIAGVAVSYKEKVGGDDVSVSGSFEGVSISYLGLNSDSANKDRSLVTVSGELSGVSLKYATATADSSATIEGDTWMGDFEAASGAYDLSAGQDVATFEAKTSVAGNTVTFRHTSIDGVTGEDTSFNKVILTRPLSNGTTFEATFTDLDDDGSTTTDGTTIDLELAVKF
jgi:hypothetical protein